MSRIIIVLLTAIMSVGWLTLLLFLFLFIFGLLGLVVGAADFIQNPFGNCHLHNILSNRYLATNWTLALSCLNHNSCVHLDLPLRIAPHTLIATLHAMRVLHQLGMMSQDHPTEVKRTVKCSPDSTLDKTRPIYKGCNTGRRLGRLPIWNQIMTAYFR